MMQDLTGQRFGRYTILSFDRRDGATYFWNCRCDCGTVKSVRANALKKGTTKSCGCLNREQSAERSRSQFSTHGLKKHPLYSIRTHMITRCYNRNYESFEHYGSRGIKVCDEWLDKENGFVRFYEWAISNGWQKGLTIDRVDVDGDYEPSNCRWITMAEQQRNKRNIKQITFRGQSKTLAEWARELGFGRRTLADRLRLGWSVERAFTTPSRRTVPHVE